MMSKKQVRLRICSAILEKDLLDPKSDSLLLKPLQNFTADVFSALAGVND